VITIVFLFVYGMLFPKLSTGSFVLKTVYITAYLSISFAIFNLIPISPLDGSKILFSVLPSERYDQLMRYERYGMMLLVLLLLVGALDGPLQLLQQGLVDGLLAVSEPVAYAIAGA